MVAAPVSRSLWRDALKRLFKNRAAVVGGAILAFFTVVAVFAPIVAPHHYAEGNLFANYAPPSREYPLGADFLGRDLLSRLIYGTRISLAVGFLGAFFAFSIGLAYGTVSGYFSGRVDNVLMRIVDILYAFPSLLFIILLMITFKTGFGGNVMQNPFAQALAALDSSLGGMLFIVVGISLTSWVSMARLTRGMALSLRETEFIQAAKSLGARDVRIISRHVVPNLIGPLLVRVTLDIPQFIATEAFLSFIGLGANPPTPSWGMMIAEGFKAMRSHPHLAIFPGLALAIVMFAFNFLGDGLRDALDPRFDQPTNK
jgi:oligopeptide transport system permease protein